MAMVTRSERSIDFAGKGTNAPVGPGYYEYQESRSVKPNFASFGSSMSRTKKSEGSSNPGPGAYLDSTSNTLMLKSSNKLGSTAFTSTAARTASLCPGATPFQNPTNIDCPGPGTYEAHYSKSQPSSKKRDNGRSSCKLVVAPAFNPPTVPSTLSKGPFVASRGFTDMSTTTNVSSNSEVLRTVVKAKESSPNVFSGIGEDRVGPCEYNPMNNIKSSGQVDFGRSQPRELSLSVGKGAESNTPGPGTYVLPSTISAAPRPPLQGLNGFNPGHSQHDAPNGRSSFFASTAPRVALVGTGTTNELGPGSYVGSGGVGDSLMSDTLWIEKQYRQSAAGFGAGSSERSGFLGVSKQGKPGPGQYGIRSDFDFEAPYTLTDRAVGFNCSGARSCIPNAPEQTVRTSKSAPGPGEYDLENVNGLVNGYDRTRKLGLGRNGPFGTSGERFKKSIDLPPHLGGPTQVNESISEESKSHLPKGSRLGGGAGGNGSTQRPGRLLRTHLGSYARLPQVTPDGRLVTQPDLGGHSLQKSQDCRNVQNSVPILSNLNSSLETKGGVGVWSKTTEPRFSERKVMGNLIPETPGPFRYQTNVSSFITAKRNVNARVNSFSSGERFKEKKDNPHVGPGMYDTSASWVKKSYNISFVPQAKAQ